MSATLETPIENYTRIRAALYGMPWMMTEEALNLMVGIFESHCAGKTPEFEAKKNDDGDGDNDLGFDYSNDVATIPVRGPIFTRANMMTRFSGATALSDLSSALDVACSLNPSCIIFDIDSPGGNVQGAKDFANEIAEASDENSFPILAMASGQCCSLAYLIASQCDQIYSTDGSMVGSIGVVMAVDNIDRAKRNMGIDPIVLRSSELKAIGMGGITPNQEAEMRRMMGMHFDMFKSAVISGRPGIDINKVATGQIWQGRSHGAEPSAQDMGLIDGITTLTKLQQQYAR